MKRQLKKFDIQPNWVDAVDRERFQGFPEDYKSSLSHKWIKRDMGLGEIACLMSHLKAYQELIESGDEWAIILEDDVVLHRDPRTILDKLPKVDGLKLVLGTVASNAKRVIRQSFGSLHELEMVPYGAYCYAIHRKFAAQAIAHLRQTLHLPIDVYFRYAGLRNNGEFWQEYGIAEEGSIGHVSAIGDEGRMHDRHPSAWRPLAENNACPYLIHQIWIGGPPPQEIESWKKHNPQRLHILWGEGEVQQICKDYGLESVCNLYLNKRMYPAVADIARYCILHRHGGFYADADSKALRELEIKTPFLVSESETYRPGLLCNGFIQTKANCSLMADCLDFIREFQHPSDEGRVWANLGPGLLTEKSKSHCIEKLPSGLFLPEHYLGKNPECELPYCEHNWNSTLK